MSKITEYQDKLLDKAFKGDDESHHLFWKYYPRLKNLVWSIVGFFASTFIFFRVLERYGFHKTVIMLMILIAVYLRAFLKINVDAKR